MENLLNSFRKEWHKELHEAPKHKQMDDEHPVEQKLEEDAKVDEGNVSLHFQWVFHTFKCLYYRQEICS